jgi:hypothetical protein
VTVRELFFLKVMEECSEVSQRVSKLMQFGADEIQDSQELTNAQRLRAELNDLLTIVTWLEERGEIMKEPDLPAYMKTKRHKLVKYLKIAAKQGNISDWPTENW